MKNIYILILFSNCLFSQINDSIFSKNVLIQKEVLIEKFDYFSIKLINNYKFDEVVSNDMCVLSKNIPNINRIIQPKNTTFSFPTYYSFDKLNDTVVINEYNFVNMYKIVKESKEIITPEKVNFILKKKGFEVNSVILNNVKLLYLKMSVGYFNKYTKTMKITGDFDEFINVIYICGNVY